MTVSTNVNIQTGSDYRLLKSRPLRSRHASREASEPSTLTIVNTKKFGKRILISPELIEHIGSPESVQLEIAGSGISIGASLPECDSLYNLRINGKKKVLYASEVVDELTEIFHLDFSGRTSISFRDVTYMDFEGNPVAYVPLGTVDPFEEEEQWDDEELDQIEDEDIASLDEAESDQLDEDEVDLLDDNDSNIE